MSGKKKSSFAMTCNRLSLFLKDKGKLESYSTTTEMNKTTVDLFSKMESSVNMSVKTEKSVNHPPQYVSVDLFGKPDELTNKATGSKTAQMTILYRGQVLVFDCISADKARDMILATAGASSNNNNNQIQNRISSASTSDSPSEGFGSRVSILPGLQLNGSDLPIARRPSLHKFLARRKERASERAPYQLPNRLMVAPSSNHMFDLNM